MKGKIVSEDEFDRGTRELLNLGHTFGHAIEACSIYKISHGHAVAIGMNIAGRVSCRLGLCSEACSEEITAALQTLGFDLACPYPMDALYQVMLRDNRVGENFSINEKFSTSHTTYPDFIVIPKS